MPSSTSAYPEKHKVGPQPQEPLVAALLLLFAVAWNLVRLWPEVSVRVPPLNDGVLHLAALRQSAAALASGRDPTDAWLPGIALGYPLGHHYQHLPYLLPAALYALSRGTIPLFDLFNWTRYLLLSLYPLSIYAAMRRLGFGALVAAFGGLAAPLLATDGLYGLDMNSYLWQGYGMYTQLWGAFLLPLALAQGYATLRTGRGYAASIALLAATALSHLVFGYIALASLLLLALLPALGRRGSRVTHPSERESSPRLEVSVLPASPQQAGARIAVGRPSSFVLRRSSVVCRLALILAGVALLTTYFWLSYLLDRPYMNRSVWEDPGKYDAYGHEWTLQALVQGDMFDHGRFPALTALIGLGLVLCLRRWREERFRVPVVLFAAWLLLYFGRPTWGVLLDLLPMGRDLHLHRLIVGVHLGGIMLAGVGLGLPWSWALGRAYSGRRWGTTSLLAAAIFTGLLLYTAYRERGVYLAENARLMRESRDTLVDEGADVDALIARLHHLPPGRVYAGRGGNWGPEYTVGDIPVYALLNGAELDVLGYLYHALSLNADVQVLFDESRPEQYDLFNVRYVVAPAGRALPQFVRPIAQFGRHRLYEVSTSGYFDLVESQVAFWGDKEDWYPAVSHWLAGDMPRAGQHPTVILEAGAGGVPSDYPLARAGELLPSTPLPPAPDLGRVVEQSVAGGAYAARVEVARASVLLLKVTYHPNWRAWVDGREVEPQMLMPSYLGVPVSPGVHHVSFEYRPRPLRRTLQIVGLLALLGIAVAERRREWLSRLLAAPWQRIASAVVPLRSAIARSWAGSLGERLWLMNRERLGPHLPYLGGVILAALLAGLPLLQFKILDGHDALAYLPRTVEFVQGLRSGQLYPRWAPDLGAGYGEPTFNYNAPLIYALSAGFHALGFGFIPSQNLACLSLLCFAGLGMYVLAQEAFGPRGGLVAAVAYLYAPYLLAVLYVRYALADFSAFAFIPLAFWGLYRFSRTGGYTSLLIGALALALLVLSSNSVALLAFPALLLLLGWMVLEPVVEPVLSPVEGRVLRRGSGRSLQSGSGRPLQPDSERPAQKWPFDSQTAAVLLRGVLCLALGLGLSAFFWLPALAERGYVHVYRRLEGYLDYHNHFVYLWQFFHSPWGYGLSLPGPEDGISFALGPVHLALLAIALLVAAVPFLRRIRKASRPGGLLVSFFVTLCLLAAFIASRGSIWLWERLPILHPLQFPWRALSLIAPATAFLCGFPFLLLPGDDKRLANGLGLASSLMLANVLMLAMIAALFLLGIPHAKPQGYLEIDEADYSPADIAARGIEATARQFEPIWVTERPQVPAREPVTLLHGQGRLLSTRPSPTTYEIDAQITADARLRVNAFYFPGWTLLVDGVERPIEVQDPQGNPQGTIEFNLERGEHRVRVYFADTPVRLWSTRLSVVSLFLLLLSPMYLHRPGQR
jgi:hypothetical protein